MITWDGVTLEKKKKNNEVDKYSTNLKYITTQSLF